MPTYEYVCDACQNEFEQFQSIKDDPLTKCPKCSKKKLRRKIGVGGGFIFKGSGFYITDYRSDSYKDAAKRDSGGGESSKPAADSTKSESTAPSSPAAPAAKSAKKPSSEGKSKTKPAK